MGSTVVVVTGSTGFVGRSLVPKLLERIRINNEGQEHDTVVVRTLTRQPYAAPFLSHHLETYRCGDWSTFHERTSSAPGAGGSSSIAAVSRSPSSSSSSAAAVYDDETLVALKGATSVIHLGSPVVFFPSEQGAEALRRQAAGNVALFRAAAQNGCSRFVYVSSTEAMGAAPSGSSRSRTATLLDLDLRRGDAVKSDAVGSSINAAANAKRLSTTTKQDELAICRPNFAYGAAKVLSEEALREEAKLFPNTRLIILRPTGIFGPGDTSSLAFEMMQIVNFGAMFVLPGPCEGLIQYSHVEDVCHAIIAALEVSETALTSSNLEGLSGTLILAPDDAVTHAENISMIAHACGRSHPLFVFPLALLQILLLFVSPVYRLLVPRTEGALEPLMIEQLSTDRFYSNAAAKRILGWQPRYTFATGLNTTMQAHFEQGKLRRWRVSPLVVSSLLFLVLLVAALMR